MISVIAKSISTVLECSISHNDLLLKHKRVAAASDIRPYAWDEKSRTEICRSNWIGYGLTIKSLYESLLGLTRVITIWYEKRYKKRTWSD